MSFTIPFHPIKYPWHTWRSYLVQPFFWCMMLLSPALGILRFDVVNQQVMFLKQTYPMNPTTMMWLPITFFSCVLIIGVSTVFFGRLFCGWVCPHNTLSEWLAPVRMWVGLAQKPFWMKQAEQRSVWIKTGIILGAIAWGLVVTAIISTLFVWYFYPMEQYLVEFQAGQLPPILLASQGMLMLVGSFLLFSGHEFCRNACPYGLLQSFSAYITASWLPMEIRFRSGFSKNDCGKCAACKTACPVDIDPRQPEKLFVGIGEGCFNCGQCIDACASVHQQHTEHSGETFLRFQLPGVYPDQPKTKEGREVAE